MPSRNHGGPVRGAELISHLIIGDLHVLGAASRGLGYRPAPVLHPPDKHVVPSVHAAVFEQCVHQARLVLIRAADNR